MLDARNRERQAVEGDILRDALAMAEALSDERRAQRGLVLASPDWHVGVVGIVAARVAERLRRPTVLIALEGEEGRGSGRSLPTFDLHAGLAACAEHLVAWGGHRAAAGVTVRADAVEAFAAAFAAHADATLEDDDLVAVERMDAIVSLSDVSLDLADELAQLEPHGLAQPRRPPARARASSWRASPRSARRASTCASRRARRRAPAGRSSGAPAATSRAWRRAAATTSTAASSATTGTAPRACS